MTTLQKYQKVKQALPKYVNSFFVSLDSASINTKYGYATDLSIFFYFLENELHKDIYNITTIQELTIDEIEFFLEWISNYERNGKTYNCSNTAKSRKLATIKSMFKVFARKGLIAKNVASLIQSPKIHDKNIVRLEGSEKSKLLANLETRYLLSGKEVAYAQKTQARDKAIIGLFLATGMRLSELININISDIDFEINGVKIIRKGGKEAMLYFSQSISNILQNYLVERESMLNNSQDALFLSLKGNRISVRAVQNLVSKYTKRVTNKNISPHKLRATFATDLYSQTRDIFIVADFLGHNDINTTKKHYATISDDIKRTVANNIKL